jgi:hypothetical protein
MTTMLEFRDRVIERMRDIKEAADVQAIRGTLTEEGLSRLSVRTPGIFVALLGFRQMKMLDIGRYRTTLVLGAFIITEGQDRLDVGHSMLEEVALLVAGNTWGLPNTLLPEEVKGEPIYDDRYKDREERTSHLQENGVFIQGVSWTQETTVTRTPTNQPGARADDVADDKALGRNTGEPNWPSTISGSDTFGGVK